MARSAVLTGRTLSDVVTDSLGLTVMLGVGLIVGFSFGGSVPEVIAGIGLMLLIGYAFSWVFAWIGLIVRRLSRQTPSASSSSSRSRSSRRRSSRPTRCPSRSRPSRPDINPFSYMVDAGRALFLGTPAGNDIWVSVAWCLGLIAVFGSLAVARYRRAVAS